ncbi:hypothetical protein D9M69_712790 [compost metagenome]
MLFQLRHRGIKSALPDQHLHLGECVDVSFTILLQRGISGFALWQIEQWFKRIECLGNPFLGSVD